MKQSAKKEIGAILKKTKVTFRVWAPFATTVALSGTFNNWAKLPMNSEGDGYWALDYQGAIAGQEYKYVITTGESERYKNDPRSLQLTTSEGNSLIVGTSFDWGDTSQPYIKLNEQIIYEVHVGTFNRSDPSTIGTFKDLNDKLDYLVDLGVNTLELMPVAAMPMDRGWGYAPDYIYAVESLYGGRHEFNKLIKEAHKRGLSVILDVVYNHFGPGGGLDIWQFDGWNQDGKGGIYFYNDWRSETPWGQTRPDYGREEVRQYILDNARMWLIDCQLDGLRLDSTIYIRNVKGHNNDPGNDLADGWRILQSVTTLARKINPKAVLIAEDVSGNEYITKPKTEGGAGFSTQWEVNLPHIIHDLLDVTKDEYRHLGALSEALQIRYNNDVFQRVIYSDSHDSAANGGARLIEEISPGHPSSVFARKRALLAATIILTAPGVPMLFQGQEFLQGGSFNDWQALDWINVDKYPGIITAHKHLIALRKNIYGNSRGLTGQCLKILHLNEDNKVLAYHRWEMGGVGDDVIVIINFANKVWNNYEIEFPRDGTWQVRFNSSWEGYSSDFKNSKSVNEVKVKNHQGATSLNPYSALILSQD